MVFKKVARAFFIALLIFLGAHSSISRVSATENSEVVHSDMFEFEAYIKDTDIIDGTAPFDSDDEPGNDSGNKNGIVRTFDTATYPIKITINPKKADMLENIKLRITGYVENGVTDGRVNASFAVGGKESIAKEEVSFEQTYMMARTGNSVMIPIAINVGGAEDGIELKPNIKVQVVSIDGVDISDENIITTFDDLPSVRTSAKVNIKALWTISGFGGSRTYSSIVRDSDSDDWLYKRGLSFGLANLPGKSDSRGSTFPSGKIKFSMDIDGQVVWDKSKNEKLDFSGKDTPVTLFDHQPENTVSNKVGSANTEMDGISYVYTTPYANTARSTIANYNDPVNIEKWSYNSVWDSGNYEVSKPTHTKGLTSIDGSFDDYVIGSTFPLYRTDGYTGYTTFGVNDKIFSTHVLTFRTPNEYRQGGVNNDRNEGNNVYYTVKLTIESYEDSDGVEHPVNKTYNNTIYERNNLAGSMNVNNTFFSINGRDLGSHVIGDSYISTGDPTTILGEDVKFYSYVNYRTIFYGGMKILYRWNPDSFQLTEQYARDNEKRIYQNGYNDKDSVTRIRNNYDKHKITYGVQKDRDTSFEKLIKYRIDDYEWFDTYEEAVSVGDIGAIQSDIQDVMGADVNYNQISLHVKSRNMGGINDKGTENIAITDVYAYKDADRRSEYILNENRVYNHATQFNEAGEITKNQSPVGGGVNFETLGVLNAELSSVISSDKPTYYNSEEVKWTVKSSILLPENVAIESDGGVQFKQILPKGLDYKAGSGVQAGVPREPEIINNSDGTTFLIWETLLSRDDARIDDIQFTTTINPFALSSGVQSSVEITNIMSSDLDTRKEKLRTSTKSINILKVGMVGIHETIYELFGGKHSDYIIRLRPYTTIDDEHDVMGLTNMPKTGDRFGSVFQGTAELVEVGVDANRPVSIYLNNQYIESDKPHEIDYTKDGWYKYTGKEDISKAQSLLFHVEGVMKNTDDIEIAFQVQTSDNNFGDVYYNETVVNSATNYRLSPISNRVRHTIRADVEFNIERIRIYTANAKEGLPVRVRVNKVINRDRSNNERLKLVLYEYDEELKSYSKAVYEKEFTVASLEQENALSIPSQYLSPNTNRSYEARIEGYNTDRLYVLEGADRINTLGYTATETEIDYEMTSPKALTFKGVVMTERRLGFDIDTLYERIRLPISPLDSVESGDGIEINQKLQYKNDVGFSNYTSPEFAAVLDERIFNGSYGEKLEDGTVRIHLEQGGQENSAGEMIDTYRPPHVYVEEKKGTIYSDEQYAAVKDTLDRAVVSGGNKVYVPVEVDVWGDELGQFPYRLESVTPIGVNEVRVVVRSSVEVTRLDIDSPVGQITARYDRSERDDHVGYTSNDLVDMIDSNRVTVDVTGVEDVGVSGVDFVTIEEQRRIGYGSDWMTVREIEYDWPDPYNTRSQTYDIDVSHAQDTRFILTVTDRAGNKSNRVASNVVRQSVLQAVDFRITNVVNPQLTEEDLAAIRASDLSEGVVELTAGTNVTFDVTYQLRHLATVDELSGKITIKTISDDRTHTQEIEVKEDLTGHNQNVNFTKTFTVPQGAPKGSKITIVGNLEAKLANGTTHKITYPSTEDGSVIGNHIEEFFRFRIVR